MPSCSVQAVINTVIFDGPYMMFSVLYRTKNRNRTLQTLYRSDNLK
jgi:hypothetical protein